MLGLAIFKLLICCTNIVMHSSGLWALSSLQRKKHSTQRLLILNLSSAELTWSIVAIIKLMLDWLKMTKSTAHEYLTIIELTGLMWIFLPSMSLITLDRFFRVYYLMEYHIIFTKRRVRWASIVLWAICVVSCATICLLYNEIKIDYSEIFFKYIYPPLDLTFILSALLTYGYIIHTQITLLKKTSSITVSRERRPEISNQVVSSDDSEGTRASLEANNFLASKARIPIKVQPIHENPIPQIESAEYILDPVQVTRKKPGSRIESAKIDHTLPKEYANSQKLISILKRKLFVSSMIISTFIIFIMIPDLTYLTIVYIKSKPVSINFQSVTWIMYMTGLLSDSIIYIFLQRGVRRELQHLFATKWRQMKGLLTGCK